MNKSSLDLNLGQHSSNNNFNINMNTNNNNNNNSNLSASSSSSVSNENECIFNCSYTQQHLIITNNNNINNNNSNTKTGRQMMAAQETKTADESVKEESVRNANITKTSGSGLIVGVLRAHNRDDIMYNAEEENAKQAAGSGGILVDESASYEADASNDRVRSSGDDAGWDDEYEDEEEEENDDDDEDEMVGDEDDAYADDDDDDEHEPVVNADRGHVVETATPTTAFEALPEAKGLVQSLVGDENESVKIMSPDVLNAKTISASASKVTQEEEEEDMGFDEDDERIAIIVERQRSSGNENDKGFMNEESSGAGGGGGAYRRTDANRYKNSRFRLDYLEKYRRKQQKLQTEYTNGRGLADAREGSGNFANDDDDDDDDDSDDDADDADDDDGVDVDDAGAINADANDDADRQEGDGYFNSKHTKSSNRYFRKNTNDAIKIISTPLGKVGIVYQQTPTNEDGSSSNNNNNANGNTNLKKQDALGDKKTSSFTDFDALSPDPESSHRLASSHPKITPVLTPDGKVALLYRGDSENSKYEPIRNLTHKFNNNNNNNNDFTDNKATASGTISKDTPDLQNNDGSEDESADASEDDEYDLDNDSSGSSDRTHTRKSSLPTDETQKAAIQNPATDAEAPAAAGGSFIIRPTDSVLPMINRPLSEVLGIKKNQFKQFRIKDIPTNPPPIAEAPSDPRSLAGTSIDRTIDTTTLHFLTKVNLAEYPTSMKTRNFDFDFSRDNTMLDERSRHKEHQHHQQQQQNSASGGATINSDEAGSNNNKLNTIANEEVLAKTEVVNLAIIPHFDEELERLQRLREHETRRHYRQRYRQKPSEEELSGIHCIMQAMMGIAAISTVFGMLGTFFKQRILDQIRLMHW